MLIRDSLIAVMLGRLRMTIGEAIGNYKHLSRETFAKTPRIRKPSAIRATLRTLIRTTNVEEALKEVIGDDWKEDLLKDGSKGSGKVYEPLRRHLSIS